MTNGFSTRGRALEEAFFRKIDQELIDKIRQQEKEKEAKEALKLVSGICDDGLLTELVRIGVTADTFSAVTLIPLVAVAWADGKVDDEERRRTLLAEEKAGISPDSMAHQLLEYWLSNQPDENILDVWEQYVVELLKKLSAEKAKLFDRDLIKRAEHVAKASGGYFSFGAVSPSEQKVLKRIKEVLETARDADD